MSDKEPPAGSYDRNVKRSVKVERRKDNFAQATEREAAQREQLENQEAAANQVMDALAAGSIQPQEPPQLTRERRRDPVEFQIPNGLTIQMAPPREAIQFRIAKIYKQELNVDQSVIYAKAILHITKINNEFISPPTDRIQLELIANRLETDGLEMVANKMIEHFMGIDLDALKKNMLGF